MDYAVVEFCEFGAVPSVGRANEIAGDALEFVDVCTAAFRAYVEMVVGILIAAIHASVAVVVDRAVADVVAVHQLDNVGNGLRIVGGVTVDLYIEDVASASQFVIRCFNFSFMLG